jgi:hypothetical protein
VGPADIRRRLANRLAAEVPERRMMVLLDLALFIEKVQRLSNEDLNRLLRAEASSDGKVR